MPDFPAFMNPLEGGGGPAGGYADGPARNILIGLAMSGQEETNWCWSAVTQAVFQFARHAAKSQETIASDHARNSRKPYTCAPPQRKKTEGGACAPVGCRGSCNDAHILKVVLQEQGCLQGTLSSDAAPSFEQIRDEIDAGRPLACRVQWDLGGGHFIVVSGWTIGADGVERVHVLDPASNEGGRPIVEQVMPHSTFANAYEQSGVTGYINYSYRIG